MNKLKPCPFCGGKAELIIVPGYFNQGLSSSGWLVKCLAGCCNQMPYGSDHDAVEAWNRRAEKTPPQQQWISVEDSLPPERETIFAKLYGTDKWRSAMFRKISDDVRVVKVYRDGTRRVHHDHTVDGVWDSERKGDIYGHVTHWMVNPELPEEDQTIECVMCGETFIETDLTELRKMGEAYHREEGCFLCPDCWDSFQRMDPEEQARMAITNGWKEVDHGTEHAD